MLSHDMLDAWAHLGSPVHQLDARVKLVCALVLVVAILATPVAANVLQAVYAAVLVAIAAASRLPAAWVLRRMAILAPFLVLGTVAVMFLPSAEAISLWISVGGKCVLALLGSVLLAGTTTSADLLRAAHALHVPRTLTALSGFALAYIAVLAEEAGRMITAMRSRGGVRGLGRRLRVGVSMLATLMARTAERADRIALAMVARGYRGTMPALAQERVPAAQWAVVGGVVALTGALTWLGVSA